MRLNDYYIEVVSKDETFFHMFNRPSIYDFIDDNYLNSFENLEYLKLNRSNINTLRVTKESIELKLPEPYNPCMEFLADRPYQQPNCIEACIFRWIKTK